MPKLDEGALRRPDFQGGTPVALADGQTWYVPTPVLTADGFHFRPSPGGRTRLCSSFLSEPDYGALLDAYVDAETFTAQAVALYDLAFHLLSRNYDLTHEAARSVLVRYADEDPRREANDESWAEILAVALGRAPKATQGGSAPP